MDILLFTGLCKDGSTATGSLSSFQSLSSSSCALRRANEKADMTYIRLCLRQSH